MQYKKILGVLAVASIVVTAAFSQAQAGISPWYMNHYKHATKVLKNENPAFLSAFENLQNEIKTINSDQKQEQFEALMRFFPAIEEMAFMQSYVADEEVEGVLWDLQLEVVVSYFVIDMLTADIETISISDMLFDAFMRELGGGDAFEVLSEQEIMKKHNLTLEQAQKIHATLKRLYFHNR